jgi:uncharacterized protein (TIGR00288 family)
LSDADPNMKHPRGESEHTLAVFIDFENLALGFNSRRDRFRIEKVLERLVEKGKIVVKRAYCDWSRFAQYTGPLHEAAIELIEIPKRTATGKNSADIRLVVDAIDLAYSKDHIDTFVIVSGDSDFSPLVSKLKELGKHVIGLGLASATSELLRDNCDEFIYYEDLDRTPVIPVGQDLPVPENKRKVFALLMDSLLALRRENKEVIMASMVKDTMKRKKPSFNEGYHGYATFSELLEDAQKYGLLDLEKHKSSGTYVVTRFGTEPRVPATKTPPAPVRPASAQANIEPPMHRPSGEPAAAKQPRSNGRRQSTPPAAARATPNSPATIEPEEPADDRTLGRALIEDFEAVDDLDEVPSYGTRKPVASPAKPTVPPAAKPRSQTRRKTTSAPPSQGRTAERPVSKTKPAPTPAPKPAADDEETAFGAGLDL